MDIDQLNMFVRVASLKSFTKTAESLFLSQPTVSARMKSLENELGVQLFDRSRPRYLSLTEQGMIFWDYAQQILNLRDDAIIKIKDFQARPSGFLRIGAGSVPGTYILPGLLSRFNQKYSNVKLDISIKDSSEVVSGVNSYSYDLGFVGYYDDDPLLHYINIADDELILIAPPGKLSSEDGPKNQLISLKSMLNTNFIIREPGSATRKVLEVSLNEAGHSFKDFRSVIFIDNLEGIKQAVRAGLGVSVVSRLSVADYLDSGYIQGFYLQDIKLNRSFYLVYNKNRVLNNAAKAFIHYIREIYKA